MMLVNPLVIFSKNARYQYHRNYSFGPLPIRAFRCYFHHRYHETWTFLKNIGCVSYHTQTFVWQEAHSVASSVAQDSISLQ